MELLVMALRKKHAHTHTCTHTHTHVYTCTHTHTLLRQPLSIITRNSLSLPGPEVVEHLPNPLALVQFMNNGILYSLVLKAVEIFEVVYAERNALYACIVAQIEAAQSLQLVQTSGNTI